MQKQVKQVKINVPVSQQRVLEFCTKLSDNRILSATFVRLMLAELERQGKSPGSHQASTQQSIFTE